MPCTTEGSHRISSRGLHLNEPICPGRDNIENALGISAVVNPALRSRNLDQKEGEGGGPVHTFPIDWGEKHGLKEERREQPR